MKTIILASQSPRRRELLKLLEIPFIVKPSDVNETISSDQDAAQIAESLALQKMNDVAISSENALIIGADTVVVHQSRILGKPADENDAFRMLLSLSNSTHTVITGIALGVTDFHASVIKQLTFREVTTVHFAPLDEAEIRCYVQTGQPMDKAGAYGIQDPWGSRFVRKIDGDYNNVVGLPVFKLYRELKHHFSHYILPKNS